MVSVFVNATSLLEITKTRQLMIEGDTAAEVLKNIEKQFSGFIDRLLTEDGKFKNHLMLVGVYKDEALNQIITSPNDDKRNLTELKILTIYCGG